MSFLGDLKLGSFGLYGIDPVLGYVAGKSIDKLKGGNDKAKGLLKTPDGIAKFDQQFPNYRATYNAAGGAKGLNGRSYEDWLSDHLNAYPDDATNKAALAALNAGLPDVATAANPGTGTGDGSGAMPFEQGFSDYVQKNYVYPDLQADQYRSQDAANLMSQYAPLFDANRQTVASMTPTTNYAAYVDNYPDLAAAYAREAASSGLTKEQWGKIHYENHGQSEGRQAPVEQSKMLTEQLGNNETVTQDQIAALQQMVAQRTGALNTHLTNLASSLQGELGAKAANLAAQLQDLQTNADKYSDEQRQALAAQMKSAYENLETEVASKQQNLSTELASLKDANTTDAQARRTALQTQLDQLNAAQAPLNNIREMGAQTQATAVNLAVQGAQDQIRAKMAEQGYVGGSSGDSAAIARAAISGRQQAAQVVADARTLNATDTSNIAKYGANEGYGLAGRAADADLALSQFGADQNRQLGDYSAVQTRTLGDYGAGQTRTLSDAASKLNFDLGNFGATERRTLGDYGATQQRALSDYGSGATKDLSDTAATEQYGIKNTSAQRKLGYFDQDIARRLAALSLPANLANSELQVRTAADDYAQSGLQRQMKNLDWFKIGTSQAPSTQTFQGNQATDNGLGDLGAAFVGAAGNYAQANNWWATPKTPTNTSQPVNYNAPTFQSPLYDAGRTGSPINTGAIA